MFEDVCLFCSRPVEPSEVYCSDECRQSDISVSTSPSVSMSSSSFEPEAAMHVEDAMQTGTYLRPSHVRQRSSISSSSMSSGSALWTPGVAPLSDDSPDFADLEADVLALPNSMHTEQFAEASAHRLQRGLGQSSESSGFVVAHKKSFGLSYARRPSATNTRSTIPVPLPLSALSPSSSQSRHSSMSNSHSRLRPQFIRDKHMRMHSAPVNVITFAPEDEGDETTSSSREEKDTDREGALSRSLRSLLSATSGNRITRGSKPSISAKMKPALPIQHSPHPSSPTHSRYQTKRTRHDSQATLNGVNLNGTVKSKRVSLPAGFASLMQVGAEVGIRARARGLVRPQEVVLQKRPSPTQADLEKVSSGLALWKLKMRDERSQSHSRSRSGGRDSSRHREWYPTGMDAEVRRGRTAVRQGLDFNEAANAKMKEKNSLASTEPLFGLNGFGVLGDGYRRSDRERDFDRPRGRTESRGRARSGWGGQEARDATDASLHDRGRRRERTCGIGAH